MTYKASQILTLDKYINSVYYGINQPGVQPMKMPDEEMLKAVISELVSEQQKENHSKNDCQVCEFSSVVNDICEKAASLDDVYPLDKMMQMFLRINCQTLPILIATNDISAIVWLCRACFLIGMKVERMEQSTNNLEKLFKL